MTNWKTTLAVSAAWFMAVPALANPSPAAAKVAVSEAPVPIKTVPVEAAPVEEAPADASAGAVAPMQKELAAVTKMVEEWLGVKDLPPVDELRLATARTLVAPITQRSSLEKTFESLYGRMFTSFSDISTKADRAKLLRIIGVPEEQIAHISDADLNRVSDILNPHRAAQEQYLRAAVRPLADEVYTVLQPAMQEGLARAYARRFTNAEMTEVNNFFQTPTGGAFASELLALQSNPEVIVSMLRAAPDLITRIQKLAPQLEASFSAMPQPRDLHQLSDREQKQIADILKINVKKVKAALATDKAEQEASNATLAADDTAYEAYDRAYWSDAHKAAVEAAEAASEAAQSAAAEAQMAAIQDANTRLSRTPKP